MVEVEAPFFGRRQPFASRLFGRWLKLRPPLGGVDWQAPRTQPGMVSQEMDISPVPRSLVSGCMVVDLFFHDPYPVLPWRRSIRLQF